MAKLLGSALVLALVFSARSAFSATYYVSKSLGSDTANGTSEATPWAHLPGMPTCSGNCAAYSPAAGDRFILYGGDTWGASDLGIDWEWSGTGSAPIYIGVDKNKAWFKGAAWSRPIFDCQTTSGSKNTYGNLVWLAGNWTILDDIEIRGFQQGASGGMTMVTTYGNDNEDENMYVHGFSRTPGSSGDNSFCFGNNWSGGGGLRTKLHDNVCDGSDSPNKDFMGGVLHGDKVYDNVIRYVYNGLNGVFNQVYGNLIEDNYVATSGDHCNLSFIQAPFTGHTIYAYDNVIDQKLSHCSGGATLWLLGNVPLVRDVRLQQRHL